MPDEEIDLYKHRRTGDPIGCRREHERVEEDISKKIMNKMTIRMMIVMGSVATLVTALMAWVALGQVISHENIQHKQIVKQPEMKAEHAIIEQRLSSDINDLHDEVQDLGEKLDDYHEGQIKQYIKILEEIRKID